MKNRLILFIPKGLAAFLMGVILYTPGWAVPFWVSRQERPKYQFLQNFFAQKPTETRLKIKEELKKLVEKDIVSLRYAQKATGPASPGVQNMLDQINGLISPTYTQEEQDIFKQRHLRRLREPLRFYQLKLDKNPALQAYTFRPTRHVLYSDERFKIAPSSPYTADMKDILGRLFEQRTPYGALKNWPFEPAKLQVSPKEATLWFAPAQAQGLWLKIKVDFVSRLIFADLQPAP